jgi:hypothetical protein
MRLTEEVIAGTLKTDGTLELDVKPNLSPGRVQVVLSVLPQLPGNDAFSQRIQSMWESQKTRGHVPRSVEEVEGERRKIREEWDERMQRIEQVRAEAEAIRKGAP